METIGKTLITLVVLLLMGLATLGFVTVIIYRDSLPEVFTWYTCAALGAIVVGIWCYVIAYLLSFWGTSPKYLMKSWRGYK